MGIDSTYLRAPGILGLGTTEQAVVIYDQRGHGRSGRCDPQEYTHENWVKDLHQLVRTMGYERFSLLGHSYGGFLALEYALTWPDTLDRLILVGTSAGPVGVGAIPEVRSDADLRVIFRAQWPAFFYGPDKFWNVFEALNFSLEPFLAAFQVELPEYDLRARVGGIQVPSLLLCGEKDRYLESMHWLVGALPDARLTVLESCEPMPFYEEPSAFRDAIQTFLD